MSRSIKSQGQHGQMPSSQTSIIQYFSSSALVGAKYKIQGNSGVPDNIFQASDAINEKHSDCPQEYDLVEGGFGNNHDHDQDQGVFWEQ